MYNSNSLFVILLLLCSCQNKGCGAVAQPLPVFPREEVPQCGNNCNCNTNCNCACNNNCATTYPSFQPVTPMGNCEWLWIIILMSCFGKSGARGFC